MDDTWTNRTEESSVRLRAGLPSTATWVKLAPDGTLLVEFYDYSQQAQSSFGNDVAYVLTVQPPETLKLWSLFIDVEERPATTLPDAILFLQRLQERFESYFEIKRWFDENNIAYQRTFDTWA